MFHLGVNPVRNSSWVLNSGGIILKCNPAAEQWGIISDGAKNFQMSGEMQALSLRLEMP